MRRAVFLDRDGTINVEKHYLHKIEDFEFIPGGEDSIRRLKEAGYLVIVITNQSGVGRGYYKLQDVDNLHEYLQSELGRLKAEVDGFYVCPHHPTKGIDEFRVDCSCRKPQPGMLLEAAGDFDIDLKRSFVVGDKLADIGAAKAAGCTPLMVRTGYGEEELGKVSSCDFKVFASIVEATDFILGIKPEQLGK